MDEPDEGWSDEWSEDEAIEETEIFYEKEEDGPARLCDIDGNEVTVEYVSNSPNVILTCYYLKPGDWTIDMSEINIREFKFIECTVILGCHKYPRDVHRLVFRECTIIDQPCPDPVEISTKHLEFIRTQFETDANPWENNKVEPHLIDALFVSFFGYGENYELPTSKDTKEEYNRKLMQLDRVQNMLHGIITRVLNRSVRRFAFNPVDQSGRPRIHVSPRTARFIRDNYLLLRHFAWSTVVTDEDAVYVKKYLEFQTDKYAPFLDPVGAYKRRYPKSPYVDTGVSIRTMSKLHRRKFLNDNSMRRTKMRHTNE